MKIAKRANQQNAELNKDHYTRDELNAMLLHRKVFFIDRDEAGHFEIKHESRYPEEETLRVDLSSMKEIKVVLNEDGYYETVCIDEFGVKYWVNL